MYGKFGIFALPNNLSSDVAVKWYKLSKYYYNSLGFVIVSTWAQRASERARDRKDLGVIPPWCDCDGDKYRMDTLH